jgi:hypothetical protein
MIRIFLAAATAVPLMLVAACGSSKPEVIDTTGPDPMAAALANRPAVVLPPSISAEKTLRCKDNSLVHVTFFHGDTQALVSTEKNGQPTRLTAANAGDPLIGEGGWKLTGDPGAIKLTQPGKPEQSCKS